MPPRLQLTVRPKSTNRPQLKARTRDHSRTVLLIDGKYLAYRTFYGDVNTLTYNQIKTGVSFGFLNSLRSVSQKFDTGDVVIMWDGHGSRRSKVYPEYKLKRLKIDIDPKKAAAKAAFKSAFEDGYLQLMDDLGRLGFASYIMDGYEADDLLGLWINQYPVHQAIIVSRDEDLYQLLSPSVMQYDVTTKTRRDLRWFRSEYGIEPVDWIMVKALGGCKSDNVKGIGGVAEDTAIKILKGTASKNTMAKVDASQDAIARNVGLVRLPMPEIANVQLPDHRTNLDLNAWEKFCTHMGFRKFMGDYHSHFLKFWQDADHE